MTIPQINTHQQLLPGLASGNLLARCPLASLGCTWAATTLAPHCPAFTVRFSRQEESFCCRMSELEEKESVGFVARVDQVSQLPPELLLAILRLLDPISLRAVSRVSVLLRSAVSSLLPSLGCVEPVWERLERAGSSRRAGRAVWRVTRQYQNSNYYHRC